MVVIWDCNQTLKEYAKQGRNNNFPEIEECPQCKAKRRLNRHGFYYRNAIEEGGWYRIPICRLKCSSCKKTFSLLPDCLLPYFQYTLHSVMNRLRGRFEKRTRPEIRQWIRFYYKRYISQLKNIELFFRDHGYRGEHPSNIKEKAIKMLEMICAFGEATFLRRSRNHFINYFMANSL